ncbi:hypothetical protein E2C01_025854 [Portunus trituberculatus]|uniref:Uncharacterized protein n=1 Tax=Portunus trituberculatus TaxID=210409 RepID=A0A5B7EEC0_PORTR|nr:hypothetical protein [Portunus trituberculatus]
MPACTTKFWAYFADTRENWMQMVCEVENGTAAATKGGFGEPPGWGKRIRWGGGPWEGAGEHAPGGRISN